MLDIARTTDALPALKPSDFVDLDYTPALLLPTPLVSPFTSDQDYQEGCQAGFDMYFDNLLARDEYDNFVYVDVFYSEGDIARFVVDALMIVEMSLADRVGFAHGWLSALALTDRVLAQKGLIVLRNMVEWCNLCNV